MVGRYGRNSLKVSRDFLEGIWSLKVEPVLNEVLQLCPAVVLEVMLNAVLAVDTDYGTEQAIRYFKQIELIFDKFAGHPQVRELMDEIKGGDPASTYGFLLGLDHHDCYHSDLKVRRRFVLIRSFLKL